MKGSVLPEEWAELCELCAELVPDELTELGADWDSVEELDVVDVVVDVPELPLPDLVLW